jgi:hypothetical protein
MSTNNNLSFREFQEIYEKQVLYEQKHDDVQIVKEEVVTREDLDFEENEIISDDIEDEFGIKKLCRVCSNRGHIRITTIPSHKFLCIPRSRNAKMYQVTIKEMIMVIGNQKVGRNIIS